MVRIGGQIELKRMQQNFETAQFLSEAVRSARQALASGLVTGCLNFNNAITNGYARDE
jgi:hypothetical protein